MFFGKATRHGVRDASPPARAVEPSTLFALLFLPTTTLLLNQRHHTQPCSSFHCSAPERSKRPRPVPSRPSLPPPAHSDRPWFATSSKPASDLPLLRHHKPLASDSPRQDGLRLLEHPSLRLREGGQRLERWLSPSEQVPSSSTSPSTARLESLSLRSSGRTSTQPSCTRKSQAFSSSQCLLDR